MLQRIIILTLCLMTQATQASCKEESKRPSSGSKKQTQEVTGGAALVKLLGSLHTEVEGVSGASQESVFPPIKKDELLTLLKACQTSIEPLAKDPQTREFIAECNTLVLKAEKLKDKLRPFLVASYANHASAQACLNLLLCLAISDSAQTQKTMARAQKSDAVKPLEKNDQPPKCVVQ